MGVQSYSVFMIHVFWDMVLSLGEYFLTFDKDCLTQKMKALQSSKISGTIHITSWKLWILSKSAITTANFCWFCSSWKLFLCSLFNDTYSWNCMLLNGRMDSDGQKCHQLIHFGWWTWKENSVTHPFYVLYECCWWLGRNTLHEACQTGSPFKFIWQCIEHFKTNY
jgi:hypothetical protein